VAFLDILGFKSFIWSNNHHNVVEAYKTYFIQPVIRQLKEKTFQSNSKIEALFLSDSIILWTHSTEISNLKELIQLVSLLVGKSIKHGFLLRGAIVKGPLSILKESNQTFILGKGLVEAYELQNIQKWVGAILGKGVADCRVCNFLEEHDLIIKYQVPLKCEQQKEFWCLNWVKFYFPADYYCKIKKKILTSEEVEELKNTIEDDFYGPNNYFNMHMDIVKLIQQAQLSEPIRTIKIKQLEKMHENINSIKKNTYQFLKNVLLRFGLSLLR